MCTVIGYQGNKDTKDILIQALRRTKSRGPDDQRIESFGSCMLGFQRLAIMGLTNEGMQPFQLNQDALVCNGEIYGFRKIKNAYIEKGIQFKSDSDCEILLYMYQEYKCEMFKRLDAEFALILYDHESDSLIAARDPIGIRPLFYGYDSNNNIIFASEAKNLISIVKKIIPFPPGHYYKGGKFVCYRDISHVDSFKSGTLDFICKPIHDLLIQGVHKRLDADAKVGFLLSGGLDSSLVCAIASRICDKPIRTFAIGMKKDAIDLKYAKEVSEYIHSIHTEFIITKKDVINALEEVIQILATYDITTIRASIGMYLLCKKIHETTDIRVLLTGEVSDELFGYKYTDYAPNALAFQQECTKRLKELYMYDVLRADRCISTNSMEARVPFGDLDFVQYVMSIDPELKMNTYNKGKYLLRYAFKEDALLPEHILMREKAAFSDAVGHSLVDDLKAYAQTRYTNEEFHEKIKNYTFAPPFTKESLLYREIFDKYYPNQESMIKGYWMPNKEWENCDVLDPSARVLANYGDSAK